MSELQPIYLFADSHLLFWKEGDKPFLSKVREQLDHSSPKAAYIGASNNDNPEFYEIFLTAMESVGVTQCRMIKAFFEQEDQDFLNEADIILLAGGDVELGWKTFQAVEMDKALQRRFGEGALLMGVSAGAVHLGQCALTESSSETDNKNSILNTLQLLPFSVNVHEEKDEWKNLRKLVKNRGGHAKGMGIPMGGGMAFHPDFSVEPIRYPIQEIAHKEEDGEIISNLIYPPKPSESKELVAPDSSEAT